MNRRKKKGGRVPLKKAELKENRKKDLRRNVNIVKFTRISL